MHGLEAGASSFLRAAPSRRSTSSASSRGGLHRQAAPFELLQPCLSGAQISDRQRHAHASLRFGGTIAFAEVLTQHSKASGSFGWDGKELWVAGGLRATFRVYFCQAPHSRQLHVPACTHTS